MNDDERDSEVDFLFWLWFDRTLVGVNDLLFIMGFSTGLLSDLFAALFGRFVGFFVWVWVCGAVSFFVVDSWCFGASFLAVGARLDAFDDTAVDFIELRFDSIFYMKIF